MIPEVDCIGENSPNTFSYWSGGKKDNSRSHISSFLSDIFKLDEIMNDLSEDRRTVEFEIMQQSKFKLCQG